MHARFLAWISPMYFRAQRKISPLLTPRKQLETIPGIVTISSFDSPKELKELRPVFYFPVTLSWPNLFPEGATCLRLETSGYLCSRLWPQ